jgi:hypothetical protein
MHFVGMIWIYVIGYYGDGYNVGRAVRDIL